MLQTPPKKTRTASLGLDVFLRIRKNAWLAAAYKVLPEILRAGVSKFFWRQLARRVQFPQLPRVDPAAAIEGSSGAPLASAEDRPGLNIFGYLSGQFGLGESARLYARALAEAGVPISITDLDLDLPHKREAFNLPNCVVAEAPYDVDLIIVNPDYLAKALPLVESLSKPGRHRIACWFWELEKVPVQWHWALGVVDEIMIASSFIEDAFRQITDKPLLKVPLPVFDRADSGLARSDFGLPEKSFVFLTSFDFHSFMGRKNPYAAIAAFQLAFPEHRNDVVLLVKSSHGIQHPEALSELVSRVQADPRIIVRDEVIDAAHLRSLQRCADAYVSLHRAEGFGLGLAECMAIGKPVIATGWSGNMEFMDPSNSCLVDCRFVGVGEGEYPLALDARWADPDVEQAAFYMRRLVSDPDYRQQLGTRASLDARRVLAPERIATIVSRRLDVIAAKEPSSLGPSPEGDCRFPIATRN